jgi:hypothetical protein
VYSVYEQAFRRKVPPKRPFIYGLGDAISQKMTVLHRFTCLLPELCIRERKLLDHVLRPEASLAQECQGVQIRLSTSRTV